MNRDCSVVCLQNCNNMHASQARELLNKPTKDNNIIAAGSVEPPNSMVLALSLDLFRILNLKFAHDINLQSPGVPEHSDWLVPGVLRLTMPR